MILRLSQKLATKIKAGTPKVLPQDENPYADWSCHLFTADRTQYIILSNTTSLYSCVMYGKGVSDGNRFIERVLCTIRDFTEDDGQAFVYQRFIAPASATVSFAKALNRSVTSSMNELITFAKVSLENGEFAPHDVGHELNNVLLSCLANETSGGYGKPNEAFKLMAVVLLSKMS